MSVQTNLCTSGSRRFVGLAAPTILYLLNALFFPICNGTILNSSIQRVAFLVCLGFLFMVSGATRVDRIRKWQSYLPTFMEMNLIWGLQFIILLFITEMFFVHGAVLSSRKHGRDFVHHDDDAVTIDDPSHPDHLKHDYEHSMPSIITSILASMFARRNAPAASLTPKIDPENTVVPDDVEFAHDGAEYNEDLAEHGSHARHGGDEPFHASDSPHADDSPYENGSDQPHHSPGNDSPNGHGGSEEESGFGYSQYNDDAYDSGRGQREFVSQEPTIYTDLYQADYGIGGMFANMGLALSGVFSPSKGNVFLEKKRKSGGNFLEIRKKEDKPAQKTSFLGDAAHFSGKSSNFLAETGTSSGKSSNFLLETGTSSGKSSNFLVDTGISSGKSSNFLLETGTSSGKSSNFLVETGTSSVKSSNFFEGNASFLGEHASFLGDNAKVIGESAACLGGSTNFLEKSTNLLREGVSRVSESANFLGKTLSESGNFLEEGASFLGETVSRVSEHANFLSDHANFIGEQMTKVVDDAYGFLQPGDERMMP